MEGEPSVQRELGLNLVYPSPEEAGNSKFRLIIIAIHGLDTHSERTFRAYEKEGDKTSRLVHWLRDEDMLPHEFHFARIYTYDWNAATVADARGQYFHHHAQTFLRAVSREQRYRRSCPIIFIGSCYGGLILAKALCLASRADAAEREVLNAAQGIIFLGTPFRGSGGVTAANIRVLIAEIMGADASSRLIRVLQNETGSLSEIRHHFCSIIRQRWKKPCRVACFFETKPTRLLNVIKFLPKAISDLKTMVLVDSESATLDGWDQIGLDVAHPGLSKFRGPKDANYETVVEAILKIVNDTNDRPWFGGAADCQPRHELGGQISPSKEHQDRSIQQLSQTCGLDKSVTEPFANMVTGKSTGLGLPREETSVSTSTTSHSHGTTATQTSTIPPGPVYHEPYRRVPILSDDESSTSSATPGESPTVKNLRNTFMGFSLVAVGAIGDSCLRDELHGTLSTRGCNSQALLGEGTPCTAEKADIGRYPASDTFSCLSGGLDHQLKPHMPKGRLTTVTHPQHWAPLATESSSTVIITDTAAYEEPDDYYREATTMGDANPNHAGMVENVALGKLRALNGYTVEQCSRFRPGEIFEILWYEPLNRKLPTREVMSQESLAEYDGTSYYHGIRWFLVVANDEGHSTCVPLRTYERKACKKPGVQALDHGIIYQAGTNPRMLEGEPQLGFNPVRVHLYEKTRRIGKWSRVNYAKFTTVEHNLPVFFIGSVDRNDYQNIVDSAIAACWKKKVDS